MLTVSWPFGCIQGKLEHGAGESAATLQSVVERVNEIIDFLFTDHERGKDLDQIHVMAADLSEHPVLAQQRHNHKLWKERLVDLVQETPRHLQAEIRRFMELDTDHQAFASNLLDEA